MNKFIEKTSVFNASLILFCLIAIINTVLNFRVDIGLYEYGIPGRVVYWEDPIRMLLTGEEFYSEAHRNLIFDSSLRIPYLVSIISSILLVVSLLRFLVTKKKALLKFMVTVTAWVFAAHVVLNVLGLLFAALLKRNFVKGWLMEMELWYMPVALFAAFVVLTHLGKSQEQTDGAARDIQKSPNSLRLFHGTFDVLILVVSIAGFLSSYNFFRPLLNDQQAWEPGAYYTLIMLRLPLAVATVYFLFEWLLGFTPGKIITSSLVGSGDRENGVTILKRSAARLIPFEKWSILSPNIWHDSLSNTSVGYHGAEIPVIRAGKILRVAARTTFWMVWIVIALIAFHLFLIDYRDDNFIPYLKQLLVISSIFLYASIATVLAEVFRASLKPEDKRTGVFLGILSVIPVFGIIALSTVNKQLAEHCRGIYKTETAGAVTQFKNRFERNLTALGFAINIVMVIALVILLMYEHNPSVMGIWQLGGLLSFILLFAAAFGFSKAIRRLANEIWNVQEDLEEEIGESDQ